MNIQLRNSIVFTMCTIMEKKFLIVDVQKEANYLIDIEANVKIKEKKYSFEIYSKKTSIQILFSNGFQILKFLISMLVSSTIDHR